MPIILYISVYVCNDTYVYLCVCMVFQDKIVLLNSDNFLETVFAV